MKKIIGMAFIVLMVLAGCKSAENKVASVFEPIIGTWTVDILGIPTVLVFDADYNCTETTNALGVGVTKNGTWTASDKTVVCTWSNKTTDVRYYTFTTNRSQMTLSPTQNGIATTYTRIN